MADKVFTPEIVQDTPFPDGEVQVGSVTESSGGIITPTTTKETEFPSKRIPHELISSVLNTQTRRILGEETDIEPPIQLGIIGQILKNLGLK